MTLSLIPGSKFEWNLCCLTTANHRIIPGKTEQIVPKMAAALGDGDFPVEIERRLVNFDEALSEVEDILTNFQKVPYSDMCAQVTDIVTGLAERSFSRSDIRK